MEGRAGLLGMEQSWEDNVRSRFDGTMHFNFREVDGCFSVRFDSTCAISEMLRVLMVC